MKNFLKKIKNLVNVGIDIKHSRLSSFPFVSGDGFRMMCDLIIESSEDIKNLQKNITIHFKKNTEINIFVSLGFVENKLVQDNLMRQIEEFNFRDSSKVKMIFHNGDKLTDIDFFNQLHKFARLYSVNVNDAFDCVCGIPIGIENYHHMSNGLMKDFLAFRHRKIERLARDIVVLGSFNVKTNLSERMAVKNSMLNFGFEIHGSGLSHEKYLNYLQRSLFVVSPPGNGSDCHRTWEALLMGAVPVIKSNSLSKNVVENTPILEVENWDDFFSLERHQMKTIYQHKINDGLQKCTLNYWMNIINGSKE
jgi:hypothetical protein